MHKDQEARLAALSILNCVNCAKLLRSHGLLEHAGNLEAAMTALMEVLSTQVGRENLSEALDWASTEMWDGEVSSEAPPLTQ